MQYTDHECEYHGVKDTTVTERYRHLKYLNTIYMSQYSVPLSQKCTWCTLEVAEERQMGVQRDD